MKSWSINVWMHLLFYLILIEDIFSGFTGTSGALIITPDKNYLVTDFRYIEQATNQATEFEIINRQSGLISEIKQILESKKLTNVGFEGHLISYDTYVELNKGIITLISIRDSIDKIREVKNKEEIQLIKKQQKLWIKHMNIFYQ